MKHALLALRVLAAIAAVVCARALVSDGKTVARPPDVCRPYDPVLQGSP